MLLHCSLICVQKRALNLILAVLRVKDVQTKIRGNSNEFVDISKISFSDQLT